MKATLAALLFCVIAIGCVTSGGRKMSADQLGQLKPNTTTRDQMVQWFGEPLSVGLDASGKASATWMHMQMTAAPFYSDMKTQMLVAIFETNSVLLHFTLTDQIKSTNTASTISTPAKPTRGAQ